MHRTLLLTLTLVLLGSSLAAAASVRLDFNNDSAQVAGAFQISDNDLGKVDLGGRFLYNDDERTRLGSLHLDFLGEPGNVPGLTLGAGFFGAYGETHKIYDTLNFGIGVQGRYAPAELRGLGFAASFAIAPKVFSFEDSDGLYEAAGRVFYAITPNVQLYVGYQHMRGSFENGPKQYFDRDLRLGLEAFF